MGMWLVLVELVARTGDAAARSEIGFMNITTWADSDDAASAKIQEYLESLHWHLVSVEQAHVVDEGKKYGEDVVDMIERTRSNPNAVILGTFHTYKTN